MTLKPSTAFAARAFIALCGAAPLLVPAAHRTTFFLGLEIFIDLLIFLSVTLGRPSRGPAFIAAVSALLAADIMYAVKYLVPDLPNALFQVQVVCYMTYSLSAAYFLFRTYSESAPFKKVEARVFLVLFACFAMLQIKYVAIPVFTGIYASNFVYVTTTVHRTAESAVLALAVLLGMRARSPYWLLTLNGLTLLPLSSFAIGYSTTTANGVPFQEYGWVLGLLSLLAAQTYPYRPASGFARWNSIRVRLVLLVSLVSAGLLLLLYLLSAFVAQDAFHLTSSFFFLMFAVWMLANLVSYRVAEDIRALIDGVEAGGGTRAPGGFRLTIHEAELFAEKLRAAYDTIKSQSRQAALAKLSAQVAHDIRSPLAALESAMADVPQLPEEKRLLISGAAGRIRDIAEDLLQKNRGAAAACKPHGPCALLPLIQAVLAEKRAQFGGRGGVAISGPENAPAGAGARVNGPEFCRILSNLVNNAVEALERGGAVRVGLTVSGGLALVTVSDDGKGIPPEVLAELGRSGGTYGKAGGSGLGLYHARTTAESWGGRLDIISAPGKGTAVTLTLPAVPLRAALLDDDALVRLNWTAAARTAGVELAVFGKAADLLAAAGALPADTPLYIDSELGGGEAGEHTAALLRGKGFTDITMATGHPPEKFASLPWLKVAGKEPPWAPRP